MIIHDQAKWSLTGNRKLHAANMTNFWPKNWSHSLKNCLQSQTHFWYSKITEFEQNGHLQSGCIQEMVAYKKWSLWTGGHFVCTCVNMGCWSATEAFLWIVYVQYQHLQAVFWSWMTFIGCYVPQTCSLRYQGISTMKASLL